MKTVLKVIIPKTNVAENQFPATRLYSYWGLAIWELSDYNRGSNPG